jgi:hypothetical protein
MTQEARFTPGPWTPYAKARYIHVEGKGVVAKVENPWNDNAEREANVHLIAAAPELYDLLFEIEDVGGTWLRGSLGKRIRAALAKSRGEQVSA